MNNHHVRLLKNKSGEVPAEALAFWEMVYLARAPQHGPAECASFADAALETWMSRFGQS